MNSKLLLDIIITGNIAVKEAQKENLAKGIPNVYCKNGHFYFELPDGTITTEIPEVYKDIFENLKELENYAKKFKFKLNLK